MKKLSRNAARFVLVCLYIFVAMLFVAVITRKMMFFVGGMVIAIIGLLVRSVKIRCPYCHELKKIKMMDILKWSSQISYECPTCYEIIEYDR